MKILFAYLFMFFVSACASDKYYNIQPHSISYENITESNVDPRVYSIVVARVVNKFLDGSRVVYEQIPTPSLYIKDIVKEDENLPDGLYYANKKIRDIIEGSKSYLVVNNISDADYYLDSWVSSSNSGSDNLTYTLVLMSADGQELGSWHETLKRLRNDDQSWW